MNIPVWQSEYLESTLAIAFITFGFSIYHFYAISDKMKLAFAAKHGEMKGLTRRIHAKRYLGAMTIGFIPLASCCLFLIRALRTMD